MLKIHGYNYQGYINKLSQKQISYLERLKVSVTSPQSLTIQDSHNHTQQLPVNRAQHTLIPSNVRLDNAILLRLADLCSHLARGLVFINQNQVPYQADMFSYSSGSSGHLISVHYDLTAHQHAMQHISEAALLLPGAGWHRLKKALFILAAAMMIGCGMLVMASSAPGLWVTVASVGALSAGIGFFAGRDTGLASIANKVKMQTTNDKLPIITR